MSEPTASRHNVDVNVSDYFTIDGYLFGTRSADAYKAIYKSKNQIVCLWLGRVPIEKGSPAMDDFFKRMAIMSRLQPPVSSVITYGLDVEGLPFAVLDGLDGQPIRKAQMELAEAERRFIGSLRLIDRLHQSGVVMADLCAHSFWFEREGDMSLIGVIGSHDINQDLALEQKDLNVYQYLAPEQAGDCVEDPDFPFSEDVFALGVLGYYVITGQYPWTNAEVIKPGLERFGTVKPPSAVFPKAPAWADQVIMKCIEADPSSRYQNAGQVLKSIFAIRERALQEPQPTPEEELAREQAAAQARKRESQVAVFPQQSIIAMKKREEEARLEALRKAEEESRPKRNPVKLLLLGGAAVAILAGVVIFGGGKSEPAAAVPARATPQAQPASTDSKPGEIRQLVESKDAEASNKLWSMAVGAKDDAERRVAESALIERAERHGMIKTARVIKQWLDSLPRLSLPASYESVLKCLIHNLPAEERDSALRAAYADAAPLALRIAAAMAFDTGKFGDFRGILAQLVGDSIKLEIGESHSTFAIILAQPELSVQFGDEVLSLWQQIPKEDVYWLLNEVSTKTEVNVKGIVNVALRANLIPPLKRGLVAAVKDRPDISTGVSAALVRAAFGTVRPEDLQELNSWYDPESERLLLLLSAGVEDPSILAGIFDILSPRQMVAEPAASLIGWVRTNAWEQRGQLMQAVGVLSNMDLFSPDDVRKHIAAFDAHAKDTALLAILLSSANPTLVRIALERYGAQMGQSAILKLLGHQDPGVRIQAVKYLVKFDDVEALRLAVAQYEKEKDLSVRQAYKDVFYILKKKGTIKGN